MGERHIFLHMETFSDFFELGSGDPYYIIEQCGLPFFFQGLLAGVPLMYILPCLAYLKLEPSPVLSREKAPALIITIMSTLMIIVGIFMEGYGALDEISCSHGKEMSYCHHKIREIGGAAMSHDNQTSTL